MELKKGVRQHRKPRLLLFTLLAVMLAAAFSYAFLNAQLRPALLQLAKTRVQSAASDEMHEAVLYCLEEYAAASFVDILKTDDQVFYIELKNLELTRFSSRCAKTAQARLTSLGEQGIELPIGSISSVPLLSGYGPSILLTFYPESAVNAAFSSEFRTAGINQTLHRVILRLAAEITVVLPSDVQVVSTWVDVPIAEHIIVGKVPEAFTDVNNEDDMLHLIPNTW